jgi:osmotically inducible protein OsmC
VVDPTPRAYYFQEKGGGGFHIVSIHLDTEAAVPGIDAAKFAEVAEGAKNNYPVSKLSSTACRV